jgi:hypothetical protein
MDVTTFCQHEDTFSKLPDDALFDRPVNTGRRVPPDITNYCSNVVLALRELRDVYWQSLTPDLQMEVRQESEKSVEITLNTSKYSPSEVDNLPIQWSKV